MSRVKVTSPRTGQLTDIEKMSREELAEVCAWTTETELELLWRFIETERLVERADRFLSSIARNEIKEAQP